ncbi:MAG: hypothetical protein KatS3mg065_0494 [Chloroflexota bacterium]|nr:MAG: hypothetical protein KatS3mg065_0494 [Chloroflexota bacterium]
MKWKSPTIGVPTPRSRSLRIISGTARAAASVFTVTRTSSLPAWARRATWRAVASGSAVSVFVIDWTTIGCPEPIGTPPTSTVTVGRRRLPMGEAPEAAPAAGREHIGRRAGGPAGSVHSRRQGTDVRAHG